MKRYRIDTSMIIDQKTGDILSLTKAKNKLNVYDERLTDKDELLQKQIAVSQNLDKQLTLKEREIHNIKRTLNDMIDNERTHLGHNALVQFREAIQ